MLQKHLQLGLSVSKVLKRNLGVSVCALQQKVAGSDPVQQLFLQKIRDYAQKEKTSSGKLVESTPEVEKAYREEIERVARSFRIEGEAEKFPTFNFKPPKVDAIELSETVKGGH